MSDLKEVALLGGKVRFIPVRLTEPWMGYPAGMEISLNHIKVQNLLDRNAAVLLSEEKDKDKGGDEAKDKEKEAKRAETKDIAKAPKDKMQKPSRQKKT